MLRLTKSLLATVLAVTALCCAVACTTTPRKTSEQQLADKETAERVEMALNADTHIYARHISVRADNGVVRLGGIVWNYEDLYEAQQVARAVPGVTEVIDDMELERNGIDNTDMSR